MPRGDRKPYLEALILGGVNLDSDLMRRVHLKRDRRGLRPTEAGHFPPGPHTHLGSQVRVEGRRADS